MGIFGNLFRGARTLLKTSLQVGSIYTLFAYFYVQEINHRLGDTQQVDKINEELFRNWMKSIEGEKNQDEWIIYFGMAIRNIYVFYARAWNFREFNQACEVFHKNVVRTVLKNYEDYGIFRSRKEMERNLAKNEINPQILKKILEVKEVNAQLTSTTSNLYLNIIEKQISMNTGSIMGLSAEERSKIDLVYNYIEKGLYVSSNSQEEYWKYKLMQAQIRKHSYNDTIFKLLYI